MVEHMRSYEDQLRQEVLLNIERLQARGGSWAGKVCLELGRVDLRWVRPHPRVLAECVLPPCHHQCSCGAGGPD